MINNVVFELVLERKIVIVFVGATVVLAGVEEAIWIVGATEVARAARIAVKTGAVVAEAGEGVANDVGKDGFWV